MKPILLMLLALGAITSPSWAGEDDKLWPTDLTSLGDCVTARITATKNDKQNSLDNTYCVHGNRGDLEKTKVCIDNSLAVPDVTFFTDRCGSEEGAYFISLNGTEHTLRRIKNIPSSPVPFAGTYKGDNIVVTIESSKLLDTSDEDGLTEEEFDVIVSVTQKGHTEKINGIFWHRY